MQEARPDTAVSSFLRWGCNLSKGQAAQIARAAYLTAVEANEGIDAGPAACGIVIQQGLHDVISRDIRMGQKFGLAMLLRVCQAIMQHPADWAAH